MPETISINVKQSDSTGEFGALDMTITLSQDITVHTFLETCERIAMALTYGPKSWRTAVMDKAQTYGAALNKEKHDAF